MSQLALLHPPKILATLHALSCAGPDACSCVPTYVVHKEWVKPKKRAAAVRR